MLEPPVEEPKNGTISDFQGLLRGPEMIIKLRQALQGGKLDQNTIQAIGEFFEKENYPLSQKQLKILHQSVASFEQHRRAAIKAKELYSQNQEKLKIKTAQLFNCHPVVGNSRLTRRLFSACVRILLWAKENNISQDQLTPIRTFMSESYKTRLLPTE